MALTALPVAPSRSDPPATFITRADAFMAALPGLVDEINAFALALNTFSTTSASVTSLAIGTGAKALTVDTGKSYQIGMTVKIASTATPTNWMLGDVTSYNTDTGALVVTVAVIQASGTFAAWTVTMSSPAVLTGDSTQSFLVKNILPYGSGNAPSNVAVGTSALNVGTSGGFSNTACGSYSLISNTSGIYNTSCGSSSLYGNISGNYNTACGYAALYVGGGYVNTTGLGSNAAITGSNQVQLGDSATTTFVYGTVQNRSDLRDKADVRDTVLGLSFIEALRPVDFKWDLRDSYRAAHLPLLAENATEEETAAYAVSHAAWEENAKMDNLVHDGMHKRHRYHHGLIAQEVKTVIQTTGIDFGGFQDHKISGGQDVLSLGYDELIAPMIKAIQELSAKNAALEVKLLAAGL